MCSIMIVLHAIKLIHILHSLLTKVFVNCMVSGRRLDFFA